MEEGTAVDEMDLGPYSPRLYNRKNNLTFYTLHNPDHNIKPVSSASQSPCDLTAQLSLPHRVSSFLSH